MDIGTEEHLKSYERHITMSLGSDIYLGKLQYKRCKDSTDFWNPT